MNHLNNLNKKKIKKKVWPNSKNKKKQLNKKTQEINVTFAQHHLLQKLNSSNTSIKQDMQKQNDINICLFLLCL